jgi:hypothetical protein
MCALETFLFQLDWSQATQNAMPQQELLKDETVDPNLGVNALIDQLNDFWDDHEGEERKAKCIYKQRTGMLMVSIVAESRSFNLITPMTKQEAEMIEAVINVLKEEAA